MGGYIHFTSVNDESTYVFDVQTLSLWKATATEGYEVMISLDIPPLKESGKYGQLLQLLNNNSVKAVVIEPNTELEIFGSYHGFENAKLTDLREENGFVHIYLKCSSIDERI